jgi:hypothetical protein
MSAPQRALVQTGGRKDAATSLRPCKPILRRQRDTALRFSPKNFHVLPSNLASLKVSKVE